MPANVETMFYVREKPWHGLGTEVQEAPTSADALVCAGLDWDVVQKNVYAEGGALISGYKVNTRSTDDAALGIGGTAASVVGGINRYNSPVELWLDKTGQLPPQEAGEAAYWGTQLEAIVRSEFTKRTGIEVCQVKELLQSEEYPFMPANLDGICEVPDFGICIRFIPFGALKRSGKEWSQ